jgi:hypothetical protein
LGRFEPNTSYQDVVTRKPEGLDHHLLYYDLSKIQEFYLDDLFILPCVGVLLMRNIVETIKVSTYEIYNLTLYLRLRRTIRPFLRRRGGMIGANAIRPYA